MDRKSIKEKINEIKFLLDEIEAEISNQQTAGELTISEKAKAILEVKTISENTRKFISSVKKFVDSGKTASVKQIDCVNKTYDTLF